jgi:hypothetical protein
MFNRSHSSNSNSTELERPLDKPIEQALVVAASIGSKADKNKHRARASVVGITASTSAIPVFIGLSSNNWIFGKLIPSLLAFVSVSMVAWVQLERPHERWILYRRYHRILQTEIERFTFGTDQYEHLSTNERELHLAKEVSDLQVNLHYEWEGLLPRSDQVVAAGRSRSTG